MIKKILYLVILLLIINTVSAATIHGTIYSFDLDIKTDTIVTVNSEPEQTIVSKDGTYSFELGQGEYIITAVNSEEKTTENIKIDRDGSFVLDLILFPSFEEENELLSELEDPVVDENILNEVNYMDFIILAVTLAGLGFAIYVVFKYKNMLNNVKSEIEKNAIRDVSNLADDVFKFIRSEGGRTTQKDIRNKFPSSEAKISLVITELEEKDLIKRIKKGRGNIILIK